MGDITDYGYPKYNNNTFLNIYGSTQIYKYTRV